MRRLSTLLCVALFAAACGGGEPAPTPTSLSTTVTTVPAPAGVTTTAASTTTTTVPAPTTIPTTTTVTTTTQPPSEGAAVLVTNAYGVFQIDADGTITQLVVGPVAYAVDDTHGGLLFQVDRGRDWEGFFHDPDPDHDTEVWWIPQGASAAQQLLVPTAELGHDVTLHDAYPAGYSFVVVYQRHEGTEPPFDGDMRDRLRTYDVASGSVNELFDVRGWEWNLDDVSAGGGLIVATEQQMGGAGCRLFDESGALTTRPGVPTATPSCFDETEACPTRCALSTDGDLAAFVEWPGMLVVEGDEIAIVVRSVAGETERSRILLPVDDEYGYHSLSLYRTSLLINRSDSDTARSALRVDLDRPGQSPVPLPIAGTALFTHSPVDIAAPVTSPDVADNRITLGADGLGIVSFGDPADSVMDTLTGRLGPPTSDQLIAGPWPDETGCPGATGYGCVDYLRFAAWDDSGIALVFIDASSYRDDDSPHFAGWRAWETDAHALATPEGVYPGDTVADLQDAYGSDIEFSQWLDPCADDGWEFSVRGLIGSLTGSPTTAGTSIVELSAGVGSSC